MGQAIFSVERFTSRIAHEWLLAFASGGRKAESFVLTARQRPEIRTASGI
jgi:hypothetical protein